MGQGRPRNSVADVHRESSTFRIVFPEFVDGTVCVLFGIRDVFVAAVEGSFAISAVGDSGTDGTAGANSGAGKHGGDWR
jgi:hypothetical protein